MEWVLRTCSKSLEKEQQHILHKYDHMENSNKASVKQIKILSKTFIQCIVYLRQYQRLVLTKSITMTRKR